MVTLTDDLRTAPPAFRAFRPDPLRPATLGRAVEVAHLAPWRVLAITDAATRRAIRDAHLPHWHAHLRDGGGARILAADRPAGTARALRQIDLFAQECHEAPVHLVLLARRDAPLRDDAAGDLRAALQGEGIEAAPLPVAGAAEPELAALLELAPELTVAAVLAARPHR